MGAADLMAVRALREGAPPSFELLALACGRSERLLRKRAQEENWGLPDDLPLPPSIERTRSMIGMLFNQLQRLIEDAVHRDLFDKGRIEGLSTLLKVLEKMNEIAIEQQQMDGKHAPSDEEMAAALDRIDDRIRCLAAELAERMGKAEPGTGTRIRH
ncbi:hypothetical protein ACFPOD_02565 [Nitratireductor kimnyeongensis]|uniref:Uncharacterized protein n=1 Tax=Nitratireductor kimnyeongensis TaxID=430679 RepID=A0ABW0T5V5_9HYPH|nr:hypothetical protein [Nitratireductor kimnyeongensis]QZZ35001.1 hypothetical protein KW403_14625 [Nitratireductor kimnyeongensis]